MPVFFGANTTTNNGPSRLRNGDSTAGLGDALDITGQILDNFKLGVLL